MAIFNGTNGSDTLVGSDGDDQLNGLDGNDLLDGRFGFDTIDGGAGNDTTTYAFYSGGINANLQTGTVAFPGNSNGTDTLINIENVIGSQGNDTIVGDGFDNVLSGGDGDDLIDGSFGFDTIDGGAGNDTTTYAFYSGGINANLQTGTVAFPGNGNRTDTLINIENVIGSQGNDTIIGDGFDNVLSGGDGNDLIDGSFGFDTIDGGAGNDTTTYAFYSGGINANLQTGTVAFPGNGDRTDKLINIENVIGSQGNDTIVGDGFDNVLSGGDGNDMIDGGLGKDTLIGGQGNDIYTVNDAGDMITENATEGTDVVLSSVSYTLGANLEGLSLSGTSNINGTGNDLDNVIVGNTGANSLDGAAGNDILVGGLGADTLKGGLGADKFVFTSPRSGVDHIRDFSRQQGDKVVLVSQEFQGLGLGVIPNNQFVSGSRARDRNDHLIYNRRNGSLFYDADGKGGVGQVKLAVFDTKPTLAASDFLVVASPF